MLHPLKKECFRKLFGTLFHRRFVFSSPFIYSIITFINIDLWLLYYPLGHNTILLYFLAWDVMALAIGDTFSWLLSTLTYPHHCVWGG